jgi:hypothetical protein
MREPIQRSVLVDLYGNPLSGEPEVQKRFKLVLDRLSAAPKTLSVEYKRRLILVSFLSATEFEGRDSNRFVLNAREQEFIRQGWIARAGWKLTEEKVKDVDWCPRWSLERLT